MSIRTWPIYGEMLDGTRAKGRTFVFELLGFSFDITVQRRVR